MTRHRARRVAVIGAGLSGLTCARHLADAGHEVRVFEKARGPGGRMSTRRAGDLQWDHGAQYFSVSDPAFGSQADAWCAAGIVAPWSARVVTIAAGGVTNRVSAAPRFVGVPKMSSVCRHLCAGLDVAFGVRVEGLHGEVGAWRLMDEDETDRKTYDLVVVSAPAPQAAELFDGAAPALAKKAAAARMAPCWAAMLGFRGQLDLGFDAATVHDAPLAWIARNASKPGRSGEEAWVLHGSRAWSETHLEMEPAEAALHLANAFADVVGTALPTPDHLDAQCWRFALPTEVGPEPCLFDAERGLAACGDWCGGPRVEGAFLSGRAAAQGILGYGLPGSPAGPTQDVA